MSDKNQYISITLLIPAGRVPLDIMEKSLELAKKFNLEVYLTTAQNLRINNVPESAAPEIKEKLSALGAQFKAPGKFKIQRVCVGGPHCNLGLIDTHALNQKILDRFSSRATTKEKVKISIAGCTLGCSSTRTSDIGIESTRKGYNVFVGGKGGIAPKVGIRIKKGITEDEVLDVIGTLIDFHHGKTGKKQRMFKLLNDPDFPFTQV